MEIFLESNTQSVSLIIALFFRMKNGQPTLCASLS
ncbi:hypothetical protein EL77_2458 [Escherichia coli]|nr:hypothetical protein EL77_2458 [Escherichia coli]KGM73679.1 hypothetical protein EL78_2433 [Escherichia coli]